MPVKIFFLGNSNPNSYKRSDYKNYQMGLYSSLSAGEFITGYETIKFRDQATGKKIHTKQLIIECDDLREKRTIVLFATARSDAVVYTVTPKASETPVAFVARAKQEILNQKKYDHSDPLALKYVVITQSDLLGKEDFCSKYRVLVSFIDEQGMDGIYFTKGIRSNTKEITQDIAKNVPESPHIVSRIAGFLYCSLFCLSVGLLLFNPLTTFFEAFKNTRWNSISQVLKNIVGIALFPIEYLVVYILGVQFCNWGWHRGISFALDAPYHFVARNFSFAPTEIIISYLVIGLAVAAALLTLGVFGPAVIGGVGLTALAVQGAGIVAGWLGISGLSAVGLAVFAGAAVGIAGSLLFMSGCIVHNVYHYFCGSAKTDVPVAADEPDTTSLLSASDPQPVGSSHSQIMTLSTSSTETSASTLATASLTSATLNPSSAPPTESISATQQPPFSVYQDPPGTGQGAILFKRERESGFLISLFVDKPSDKNSVSEASPSSTHSASHPTPR